jgi:hypothetical protein
MNEPIYLGDGAYARIDQFGDVIIYTSNGIHITNSIVLGPDLILNLIEWLKKCHILL